MTVTQEMYDTYMKYKLKCESKISKHEHDVFEFENPIWNIDDFDLFPLINRACPPKFKPKMRIITSPYSKC